MALSSLLVFILLISAATSGPAQGKGKEQGPPLWFEEAAAFLGCVSRGEWQEREEEAVGQGALHGWRQTQCGV